MPEAYELNQTIRQDGRYWLNRAIFHLCYCYTLTVKIHRYIGVLQNGNYTNG